MNNRVVLFDNNGQVIQTLEIPGDPPAPDYLGFYSGLLASITYGSVIQMPATADLARAMIVFVSAIQDCMAGRENQPAMQGAIWLMLSQIPLDVAHAAELTGLMNQYHLDGVYQLQP
jgi:hypothetical protein